MNYPKRPAITVFSILCLLLIALLFTSPHAWATEAARGVEKEAGPYHVIMETEPEHITANEPAAIQITIENEAAGQPVVGAKVVLSQSVPNSREMATGQDSQMGDMTSDMDKSEIGPQEIVMREQDGMAMEAGTYMADMTFARPQQMNLTISISSSLGKNTVEFPIRVNDSGPNWVFIGSVAALIVIAGIIAGIIKKKNNAEIGGTL